MDRVIDLEDGNKIRIEELDYSGEGFLRAMFDGSSYLRIIDKSKKKLNVKNLNQWEGLEVIPLELAYNVLKEIEARMCDATEEDNETCREIIEDLYNDI